MRVYALKLYVHNSCNKEGHKMNKTIRIVSRRFCGNFRTYHYFRNYQRYKRKHTDMGGNFYCFVSLVSIGGLVILYQKLKAKKLN